LSAAQARPRETAETEEKEAEMTREVMRRLNTMIYGKDSGEKERTVRMGGRRREIWINIRLWHVLIYLCMISLTTTNDTNDCHISFH